MRGTHRLLGRQANHLELFICFSAFRNLDFIYPIGQCWLQLICPDINQQLLALNVQQQCLGAGRFDNKQHRLKKRLVDEQK